MVVAIFHCLISFQTSPWCIRVVSKDSYPLVHAYDVPLCSINTKGGGVHTLIVKPPYKKYMGPTPFVSVEHHKYGPEDTAPVNGVTMTALHTLPKRILSDRGLHWL